MDRKKTGADSDRNRMGIKNKCARYKTYSPFFLLRIFVHNMQMLWNARKENTQMYRPLRPLQVCFELTGGMGDYVIAANYLYYFAKYHGLKDECITLYFPHGYGLAKSIFDPSGGLRMREGRQYRHPGTYDVYIRLSRFPAVVFSGNIVFGCYVQKCLGILACAGSLSCGIRIFSDICRFVTDRELPIVKLWGRNGSSSRISVVFSEWERGIAGRFI